MLADFVDMDHRWPTTWPSTARLIADATATAVGAVRAQNAEILAEQVAKLAAMNTEQVGLAHASIVRTLMEQLHPDGLTGENLQDVLRDSVQSATPWLPVTVDTLVAVLTGALGVSDPDDDAPTVGPASLAQASVLVMDHVLTLLDAPPDPFIIAAINEIARAQTVEMP